MKVKRSGHHLSYYHFLTYIISHLWSGTDSESPTGYSINAPHRVTVQRGLCVNIPCSFTLPKVVTRNATGTWYNKDEESVAFSSISKRETNGRFFLSGDVWTGDCTLYIEDPIYKDEGHYHFRVEDDNMRFTYQDIKPYVEVTDLTNKPEISPIKSWLDGEEVTLSCTSPGTCFGITPKITWGGNIQNGRVENKDETHENGTKTHFSTITFTARKEQNNSPLSCTVQLKGGLTTVQEIIMKVESKRKHISDMKSYCKITGNHIECTCIIQSFPETSIRWKIDDKFYDSSDETIRISTSRSDLVTNSTLSLQMSQKDIPNIKCISSNNYGELVLDLLYKKSSTNNKFIVGMVTGNLIILLLIALGVFWYMKRHMKKKLGNNDMYELGNTGGAESVYQDLQKPTNSFYHTIIRSEQ